MYRKVIDTFSSVFVGGLFIFSGLIKLNDPIGTKIKLEEYFEVFATDFGTLFHALVPYALPIAMLMIILEVALGVAVLIRYQMKITTWVLLALMVFFTFLTFYSAYFNKVTDCGCFGDAIPLDPWQSFYKDLILMVFVAHLFWYKKSYKQLVETIAGHSIVGATTVLCIFIGIYAINHLPYIDFRPYKIGDSIQQNMIPEEAPRLTYIFKDKDGEEVASEKYLMPDAGYEYVSAEVVNEDKSTPKITDYQVVDSDGNDHTQETFEGSKLLLVFYNTEGANQEIMAKINTLVQGVEGTLSPLVITSASANDFEAFRHEHQLAVPYYFVDATVLKAMIRSNPGIMLLKDGVVLGKWHYHDVPEATEIDELLR